MTVLRHEIFHCPFKEKFASGVALGASFGGYHFMNMTICLDGQTSKGILRMK